MHLLITQLILGDVNTISIPLDAILIISLLLFFSFLAYFFHKIVNDKTTQLDQKIDINSNLESVKKKLEDQLKPEATILDLKKIEESSIKNLNFFPPSKLLGLGSFAFVAIGGASLLGLQNMQKSYDHVNTSRANIKLVNQSIKPTISMGDLKPPDKLQTNIKKINYSEPLFLSIKSSKGNDYYQVQEKQIETHFSF